MNLSNDKRTSNGNVCTRVWRLQNISSLFLFKCVSYTFNITFIDAIVSLWFTARCRTIDNTDDVGKWHPDFIFSARPSIKFLWFFHEINFYVLLIFIYVDDLANIPFFVINASHKFAKPKGGCTIGFFRRGNVCIWICFSSFCFCVDVFVFLSRLHLYYYNSNLIRSAGSRQVDRQGSPDQMRRGASSLI